MKRATELRVDDLFVRDLDALVGKTIAKAIESVSEGRVFRFTDRTWYSFSDARGNDYYWWTEDAVAIGMMTQEEADESD